MKFSRFEVRMEYLGRSMFQGQSIKELHAPAVDAIVPIFSALESSFIYLPIDEKEFVAAAQAEFARNGKPVPHEFLSAPIQYFVNSQLHYAADRTGCWLVEREAPYCLTSKHRADLRVAVRTEDSDHPPFNIWLEADHARDTRALHKNWEKVMIVLDGAGGDVFVQFLYRTKDFDRIDTIAQALVRSIRRAINSLGTSMSFVVAYATPSRLSQHEIVDSDLVLFKGASVRVNSHYFHAWKRDGDHWLLNERVHRGSVPEQDRVETAFPRIR